MNQNFTKESYYKSKFEVPDQSLATPYNRLIVFILVLIYLINAFIIGTEAQTYLKSFHTTREVMQEKFYPLVEVPRVQVTFVK